MPTTIPVLGFSPAHTAPAIGSVMSDVLEFLTLGKLPPKALGLEVKANLTREDLEAFKAPVKAPREVRPLERIQGIHHAQARLLAMGKSAVEVSAALGVSTQMVNTLQHDPTFQELMAYYKDQCDIIALDTYAKADLVKRLGLDILQERLETKPDSFSNNQLRQLTVDLMDRTDLPIKTPQGGQTGSAVITFNFANPLTAQQGPMIEGRAEEA